MGSDQPVLLSLYVYSPNKVAPIFFTLFYFLTFALHGYQCYRDKSFRLLSLLPLSALSFTLGYALRTYNAFNAYLYSPSNTNPLIIYILSQVFIYIPPPLLELANYHILGRLLAYIPQCSPLRPEAVLRIFGVMMLVVETVNALGVSLSVNLKAKQVTREFGKGMTLAALGLQLLAISTFVALATTFHRRVRAVEVRAHAVKTVLWTLYASMALILVRCVYRLVEHVGDTDVDLDAMEKVAELSPILRYEAFFYVFEAILMLVNVGLWNVSNPGRMFARDVYLSSDGITEVEYEEEKKRGIWRWTLCSAVKKLGYRLEDGLEMNGNSLRS